MCDPHQTDLPLLRRAIVLRVREDSCDVIGDGQHRSVRYASTFPTPRTERVSPGHLVATATGADGTETVIWRWYDAVVLDVDDREVRLWEPAHGEVRARRRGSSRASAPGTRAYLSAGLPGAEWWVAGATAESAEHADVDLDEVADLYSEHDLWGHLA